jgi:hypothetical protein
VRALWKKDVPLIGALLALAVAAALLARPGAPAKERKHDPYKPAPGEPLLVRYRAEGGLSPFSLVEVEVRSAADCVVRYVAHGGPRVEKRHALTEAQFADLLERLARVDFFTVDEVPRNGYIADLPSVSLALTIGEKENEVTTDGRRRASRDLAPVFAVFSAIRKAATPEPVSSGD